jgi:hypothetical protein
MFTKIMVQVIALFLDPVSTNGLPDACEVVHRLTGHPTICEVHPVGAPLYDDTICCSGDSCFATTTGKCRPGEAAYYCELGQQDSSGAVHCFHEVPAFCDLFVCPPGDGDGWADGICCGNGRCGHRDAGVTNENDRQSCDRRRAARRHRPLT